MNSIAREASIVVMTVVLMFVSDMASTSSSVKATKSIAPAANLDG